MHEWALAEGVILTALETAEKEDLTRLERVEVKIGALQRIDREVFEHAIQAVRPENDARLASTEFLLEIEPARLKCTPCGTEFTPDDAEGDLDGDQAEAIHMVPELSRAFMRCPRCSSPDFVVETGRGVWIAAVEGE